MLWSSFTPEELSRLAHEVEVPLNLPDGRIEACVASMVAAHRLCAAENLFSVRVQEQLDERSFNTRLWVSTTDSDEILHHACTFRVGGSFPLSELLWAVARDPRIELRGSETVLAWRLMVEGIRMFSFGAAQLTDPRRSHV